MIAVKRKTERGNRRLGDSSTNTTTFLKLIQRLTIFPSKLTIEILKVFLKYIAIDFDKIIFFIIVTITIIINFTYELAPVYMKN